jgi:hypothetical protein
MFPFRASSICVIFVPCQETHFTSISPRMQRIGVSLRKAAF